MTSITEAPAAAGITENGISSTPAPITPQVAVNDIGSAEDFLAAI
jgi:hypothetical protein